MSDSARDDLVRKLLEMLSTSLRDTEDALQAAEFRHAMEMETERLNHMSERLAEQQAMGERLRTIGKGLEGLRSGVSKLPNDRRPDLSVKFDALSALVGQVLDGGPPRPLASTELPRWLVLRKGQASEKKIRTDGNRIRDFLNHAGDRPVNKYRFSDFQGFASLLARVPAGYMKDPRIRHMTRQEAADYNDTLPPARRLETLVASAIDSNYFSPLRMFFSFLGAEHEFRSPLADISITIPATAKESVDRLPFSVDELNVWFKAAAKERRPDLKWLPLLATLTGARINELICLQGKDIYEINPGFWIADLTTGLNTGDGAGTRRQVKNKTSRRLFALHEALIGAGFIDYATSRDADEWVFPHAFRFGKKAVKDPAGAASKRLNARLAKLGIHKPLELTFHSSRHTAKDFMRVAKVDPRTSRMQTGHAFKDVEENYGSKKLRADEVEVLASLPLPDGLDLSPYYDSFRPRLPHAS